jgi:probable LLM family oxidoreductase
MEIGVYTFGDVSDPAPQAAAQRYRELIEEAEAAEAYGLDVFGLGEHHRADYAVSAPAVALAAIAARTQRIRLTSSVSVLSSDDPVRVFQQYATLDQISGGRAELMVGRGSFIESFPLFGYQLDDYEALFSEKLELLLALRRDTAVSWQGRLRPALHGEEIYPRPLQEQLPVWVAVGGTPASVVRTAQHGLPMALAIIGGLPERFSALTDLYRRVRQQGGAADDAPISINSHLYLADDAEAAHHEYYPAYAQVMNRIGRERGWGPLSRQHFTAATTLRGALFVGDADQIVEKILYQHQLFGHQRFMAQISMGLLPHRQVLRAIELLGRVVKPRVEQALAAVAD